MQVRIRLQKAGKVANKRYNYRIVAISRRDARDSRHLEILGFYNPARSPASLSINKERLNEWVKKGAQVSETVRSLLKKVA